MEGKRDGIELPFRFRTLVLAPLPSAGVRVPLVCLRDVYCGRGHKPAHQLAVVARLCDNELMFRLVRLKPDLAPSPTRTAGKTVSAS